MVKEMKKNKEEEEETQQKKIALAGIRTHELYLQIQAQIKICCRLSFWQEQGFKGETASRFGIEKQQTGQAQLFLKFFHNCLPSCKPF